MATKYLHTNGKETGCSIKRVKSETENWHHKINSNYNWRSDKQFRNRTCDKTGTTFLRKKKNQFTGNIVFYP